MLDFLNPAQKNQCSINVSKPVVSSILWNISVNLREPRQVSKSLSSWGYGDPLRVVDIKIFQRWVLMMRGWNFLCLMLKLIYHQLLQLSVKILMFFRHPETGNFLRFFFFSFLSLLPLSLSLFLFPSSRLCKNLHKNLSVLAFTLWSKIIFH